MRWLYLAIGLGSAAAMNAVAGVVQTLDGRTLEGEARLTNGFVVIAGVGGQDALVAATNLLNVRFNPSPAATGSLTGQGRGLLGHYFGNTNLQGSVSVRLDETVDFDWSIGSPADGLAIDYFGVAWTGELEAPATGEFKFTVAADDHAQLWINQEMVADTRKAQKASVGMSSPVRLEAGKKYPLILLYSDLVGNARVRLLWNGPGVPQGIIPRERLYPAGLLSNHVATLVTTNRGLLGTYYKDAEFSGSTVTRIDPTIDFNWSSKDPVPGVTRTNFSVRWTGQIQVDHTEEYTFYTATDERVRLWIDNKRLIDRPDQSWLQESKESLRLAAGELYDIQLETQSRSGDAVARLMWSSASVQKTNVPVSHLFPSRPARRDPFSSGGDKTPPGVVLRNGAFVAGGIEKATETSIRVGGILKNQSISTINVAQINFQPLSKAMQARMVPGRAGALLSKGDFVDGDFQSFENGRIRMSSILFGLRTFDAEKEVLAVSVRDVNPTRPKFEIRLRDRTQLHADSVRLEANALSIDDSLLGRIKIPGEELLSVTREPSPKRQPE